MSIITSDNYRDYVDCLEDKFNNDMKNKFFSDFDMDLTSYTLQKSMFNIHKHSIKELDRFMKDHLKIGQLRRVKDSVRRGSFLKKLELDSVALRSLSAIYRKEWWKLF